MSAPPPERRMREMVPLLLDFDGRGCLWRVALACGGWVTLRAVPVVTAVILALVTVEGKLLKAVVASLIALVFDAVGRRLESRFPWRAPVANRLWSFERPNPPTEVQILLRAGQVAAARTALRRSKFNPHVYGLRLGTPPQDASDLGYKIGVHEPDAWRRSESDEHRLVRIREVLSRARIRARVGGIDTP
jgi:hypothetical protein